MRVEKGPGEDASQPITRLRPDPRSQYSGVAGTSRYLRQIQLPRSPLLINRRALNPSARLGSTGQMQLSAGGG